jgi:pantoate--beta-alanine ligase
MKLITTIAEMRAHQQQVRAQGQSVAIVPTMGSIHQAHLELIRVAAHAADQVVVCIVPTPGPLGSTANWQPYSLSDLNSDLDALGNSGAHLVFALNKSSMYPRGVPNHCRIRLTGVTDRLCALKREGDQGHLYFQYVPAQLMKLFNIVNPTHLVMGQKDYQQLVLMQRVITDFEFQIQLISVPTVRDHTGLALASRNRYLSPNQRDQASELYQCIRATILALIAGHTDVSRLESDAVAKLTQPDIQMRAEYFSILHAHTLRPVTPDQLINQPLPLVVMCAIWLGTTRLIDAELVTLTA